MRKQILFLIFAVLLIVPVVNASIYSPNDNLNIKIQCKMNNSITICTNGSLCNISAYMPNSTIIIANATMNLLNSDAMIYQYDLGKQRQIGDYTIVTSCKDLNMNLSETDWFVVRVDNTSNSMAFNAFYFLFIALAIIFLVIGLWRQEWIFTIFSGIFFIIQGAYLFSNKFYYFTDGINSTIAYVLWGIGLFILIKTVVDAADVGFS